VSSLLDPFQPLLERIGGPRRAAILLVGLVTAGLIFGVSRWATAPVWVPAFVGVPVESVGKMTDKLTEAGIAFQLEKGGAEIQVKTDDLAKARVALAREGLPTAGRPGLELFDQPSWGMTDFTQRINYRRALEGELERTIGKMRGVEQAQVHVAMAENAVFRRSDRPLEASVVLKLAGGETPPADVVRGIAHLVASSVDGLDSDHVTVVDDGGRMLTLDAEDASLAGLSSRQLAVQREVESYLEKKAQGIVGQIVGGANARVQVSALVNFDRVERTVQAVDPDKQAVATEQRAEITPGAQGGAASSNVATSYETTKSTETFSGAIGNVKRLTVAVLVNDRMVPGPRPTSMPRSGAELARIDTLVRNAVGVDSARGDKLSVVNVAFDATPLVPADSLPNDVWTKIGQAQKPIATGAGLLAVLVVAVLTMRAMRPAKAAPAPAPPQQLAAVSAGPYALAAGAAEALSEGQRQQVLVAGEEGQRQQVLIAPSNIGAPIVLHEQANPVRDQVVAIIEQRPEAATRVVRNWLKQD
jgi:flagellar M-ring protein FliF